jgi:hypothetical protein
MDIHDSDFRLPDRRALAVIGNVLAALVLGFGAVVVLFAPAPGGIPELPSLITGVARIVWAVLWALTARNCLVAAALNWRLWRSTRLGPRVEQIDI